MLAAQTPCGDIEGAGGTRLTKPTVSGYPETEDAHLPQEKPLRSGEENFFGGESQETRHIGEFVRQESQREGGARLMNTRMLVLRGRRRSWLGHEEESEGEGD